MDPPKQPSRDFSLGLDQSPFKKLIFIVGAIFIFLGLLAAILAMASKPSANSTGLIKIAQDQQEMIRVSADPIKNSHNDTIQNFAVTLQLGLTSEQQELLAYMGKAGIKASAKTLSLGQNPKTDEALAAALEADTYDSTFQSIMRSSLTTYVNDITQESGTAQSKTEKQILQKDLVSAQLLQTMLPGPAQQ